MRGVINMEITTTKESRNLLLTFVKEIKDDKTYYETRKISNLKVDATNEDLYAIATKIFELCEQDNYAIKTQEVSIVESL